MDDALGGVRERVTSAGFRIDRELGGGGMARVFLATDISLDRQVVIKVLSADQSAGVNGARFRREIQLVARLQHPHVVPILSAGEAEGALYYIMPFLPGESLRARLAREGPVPVADAVGTLREILDALSFAHANGVIHRDIKPENVLIGGGHAVVADFGVARALNEAGALTSSNLALGTPAYMAPEQVAADGAIDHRADLYAVGVVAYEMLAGAPPFSGTPTQLLKAHLTTAPAPLRQRRSDVPEGVAELVMRALEKEPAHRPQSAAEMLAALAAATTPTAQPAGAGAPLGESGGNRRRARRVWIGGAVAVGLVVAGVVTWLVLRPKVMRSAQSLAIAPFSVATGDTALVRLGQNLVTTLSANLDDIGELRVADAMAVLSHARTKGTLLSVQAAVDIARKLGARSAGYGTLTPEGRNVRADLTLYEVRNPESPLLRVSATAPIDSIAMLSDSLTWRLLREIWLKGKPPTPNVAAISTRSVVALRHFLDGERASARWAGPDADEAYKRAIEADTTFWFAHYRYQVAHGWFGGIGPADTTITNRLSRHLSELPPREQRLLRARDSTQTVTDRQRRMKALLDENPGYTPAVYEYADFIVHNGGLAGWDIRDAIPYYRRLSQLMGASDLTLLSHYGPLCLKVGDRSCAQQVLTQLDSINASGPKPPFISRLVSRGLDLALHRPSPSWADSLARVVVADSIPSAVELPVMMGMLAQQPDLLIEQDRLYERIKARGGADLAAPFQSFGAMGRGDVAHLDSIWTQVPRMWPVARSLLQPEVTIPEALILSEMQGLRDPSPATADKALALVARTTATPVERTTGRWIVGASALWRGDTTLFRAELDALGRDTTVVARTASRSLNALRLGRLGGQRGRAAAAESLLVLERDQGEHFRQEPLWVALVADRIVGAQWLVEQRRYAPADSLLLYPQVFLRGPEHMMMSQVTFGMTMLLRSEIAEKLDNKQDAIAFAKTFLVTFDMAPPAAKPWLDQARDRITRLGGHLDAPQAAPVRVR